MNNCKMYLLQLKGTCLPLQKDILNNVLRLGVQLTASGQIVPLSASTYDDDTFYYFVTTYFLI